MRRLRFLGRSQETLKGFPRTARKSIGDQLKRLQDGGEPTDWKPMPTVGTGVREIRVRTGEGAYRAIYIANFEEAIFVLHCFQKKSQQTSRQDIEIARRHYRQLRDGR